MIHFTLADPTHGHQGAGTRDSPCRRQGSQLERARCDPPNRRVCGPPGLDPARRSPHTRRLRSRRNHGDRSLQATVVPELDSGSSRLLPTHPQVEGNAGWRRSEVGREDSPSVLRKAYGRRFHPQVAFVDAPIWAGVSAFGDLAREASWLV